MWQHKHPQSSACCGVGQRAGAPELAAPSLQVHNYARVADSIVGWGSSLGKWSRLENKAVVGEDVHVRPEVFLNGVIVLPHKEIKETILDVGQIIM